VDDLQRLKMKDLEAQTGVSRETIRYYIRQRLLPEPDRPRRNVAIYNAEHVARIRAIKHLQEQRYLPLSVIRNLLDHDAAAALTAATAIPGIEHLLPALVDGAQPQPPRSVADVAAGSGLPEAEIQELAQLDVIAIDDHDRVDFRDSAIVAVWGRLRAAGFTTERGYDPSTLTLYVETTRWLAREEVGRFLERLSGRLDARGSAELGAEGVRLGNELIALLRTRAIIEVMNTPPDD
jgi:DNA-binding transcriptional MerR regulator